MTGEIKALRAVPSTAAADYDVEIQNGDGQDVLNGAGADLPSSVADADNRRVPRLAASVSGQTVDAPVFLCDEALELNASGLGNSGAGEIVLVVEEP